MWKCILLIVVPFWIIDVVQYTSICELDFDQTVSLIFFIDQSVWCGMEEKKIKLRFSASTCMPIDR